MENMWFTDNAFLDFKNKTIIFVDQDNRRCEKPFPARQQWRVCNLIYYLAANKTKTRFTIKELTEAIWGGRGKELKRYKIDDVRHATGALRDLLYDEDDTRRKSFLVSDQDYVYFDPPLDKPPPDDSEPEVSESEQKEETMPEQEPEQPVEVSTKPQEEELEQPDELPPDAHEPEELEQPDELPPDAHEPEGAGQPDELPPDAHESERTGLTAAARLQLANDLLAECGLDVSEQPDKKLPDDFDSEKAGQSVNQLLGDLNSEEAGQPEAMPSNAHDPEGLEQLDMSLLRRAVDIGFGIRILLISMVGILLYRLTPLIYEYEIDKPGTIIHPLVALGIIITLILMIIVGVVGLLNDGNGQVIEAHVLKMTDYKKAPYHWIKSELRRLAGKTHVRRTAQRIIMLLVLVLLCGVILTHCADCTRDSFFRDYQTSETVMATSEVTTDLSSEWSEWIEWSSEPDIRSDDLEIETKTEEVQVPVNYHMYCYITRSLTDRSKEYRDYSIIKNYEQYGVLSAYGEIHIEETFTAECVESAEQIQPGQWTGWKTNEKLSYNRGNSTAYLIKSENFSGAFVAGDRSDYSSGMLLFFVADIDYETKSCIYYRYREKTNASEK